MLVLLLIICVSVTQAFECEIYVNVGAETQAQRNLGVRLTAEHNKTCSEIYTGHRCIVELRIQPDGSQHMIQSCAYNKSIEQQELCEQQNSCGRAGENLWRCCCNTNKCNDAGLAKRLHDDYYFPSITTTTTTSTSTKSTTTTTASTSTTTTALKTTQQESDTTTSTTDAKLECMADTFTEEGDAKDPKTLCVTHSDGWCLIMKEKSGLITQRCEESCSTGCERTTDRTVCCCKGEQCNTLCLLHTAMTGVDCVEKAEGTQSTPMWPLYLLIGLLVCSLIVIVVLVVVRATVRKRRRRNPEMRKSFIQVLMTPHERPKPYNQSKPSDQSPDSRPKHKKKRRVKSKDKVTEATPKPSTGTYVYPSSLR